MEDVTFDGAEGERRGPVVVAGVLTVGLPFIMPEFFRNDTGMGLAGLQLVLLIAMFVLDPGRIDRRSRPVHLVRLALVASSPAAPLVRVLALDRILTVAVRIPPRSARGGPWLPGSTIAHAVTRPRT